MKTWLCFGFHDDNLISVSNFEYFERIELNLNGGKCKIFEKSAAILSKELQ